MRTIKNEVLERLTNYDLDTKSVAWGKEVLQDFYAFERSGGNPGSHEKEEAKTLLCQNSMRYHEGEKGFADEIDERTNTLISFLEFHNYFYGVSSVPSCLTFTEINKKLATVAIHMYATTWDGFKDYLRESDPMFVIIYSISKRDGLWVIYWNLQKDIKSIYDNPEYLER